ncbi:MAG: ATP-binding protein [Pseudomonadota bacterium]
MKESYRPVLSSIPSILEFIERRMNAEDVSSKTVMQVCLVVEEIATNIIYHGQLAPQTLIDVVFTSDPDAITICISDQGVPFNPLEVDTPDLNTSLEEREVGGLGLFFVKQFMDRVHYKRANDRNYIYLIKNK